MKHICLNLKRFDIPPVYGGVNSISPAASYGETVVKAIQQELKSYDPKEVDFSVYFPEAHILSAVSALDADSPLQIGAQSVYRLDTAVGGNFGAFTSNRPASAVKALGCGTVMIGHCEERNDKRHILSLSGMPDEEISPLISRILNEEIHCAVHRGLKVLYCIGERSEEQERWQEVLKEQLETGLNGIDPKDAVIAYEPVWSIGPGKTPADKPYIEKIASFIHSVIPGIDIIYGGGLKTDNAEMLASIEEISGGLIALTRFSGQIGFYPEEYLEIVRKYLGK